MQEMEELARTMEDHTNQSISNAISGIGVEFGFITEAGLKLDNFRHEISDYKRLDYLNMNENYFTQTDIAGTDSHIHNVKTPGELKPLKNGDRVLVAQIGAEFIVLGRVI